MRENVVRELDRVLRAGDLRRVQAAADVDEHPAFGGEAARFGVGEPGRMRDALGDLPQPIELREVLGRRDDRERPRVAGRRLADIDETNAVRCGRELLEVRDRLVVGRELEVRAHGEAKGRIRV